MKKGGDSHLRVCVEVHVQRWSGCYARGRSRAREYSRPSISVGAQRSPAEELGPESDSPVGRSNLREVFPPGFITFSMRGIPAWETSQGARTPPASTACRYETWSSGDFSILVFIISPLTGIFVPCNTFKAFVVTASLFAETFRDLWDHETQSKVGRVVWDRERAEPPLERSRGEPMRSGVNSHGQVGWSH